MKSNAPTGSALASIETLSNTDLESFVRVLGGVFEHSPWIAQRAWSARPFASVEALHRAMLAALTAAGEDAQLALIRAHPELAGRAAAAGALTASSTTEQRGAGLDACSAEELARLRALNQAYRERFGFPFVIAVKGLDRQRILEALTQRLENSRDVEFRTCLDEIGKIARFRLEALLQPDRPPAGDAGLRNLLPAPLTREAFAPFGDVIQADQAAQHFTINGGNTERFHDLANVAPGPDGRAIVSIFRGQPRALPFLVEMMERHPLASQAFVPLGPQPYLVVVAPAGAAPTADTLHAFLASAGQGVNYAPGVWHHPLLALDAVSDFLVIDRAGPGPNCDEISLSPPAVLRGA